jgi:CheY-like chemotaxis protein
MDLNSIRMHPNRGLAIRAKVSHVCCDPRKTRIVEAVSRVLTAEDASFLADVMSDQSTSHETATKPAARILIAEDRPSMRHALGVLFGLHKNWEVCGEAEDAKEAIRKAEELHPDLIVLDYKMHCSDGFQAANGILRALPDVPIVMFTLYKTDERERVRSRSGFAALSVRKKACKHCSMPWKSYYLRLKPICPRSTLFSFENQ